MKRCANRHGLRLDHLESRIVPSFPQAVNDSFDVVARQLTTLDVLSNDSFASRTRISSFTSPPTSVGELVQDGNSFRFFGNSNFQDTSFTYTVAPTTPETILTAFDAEANAGFGNRSAISRDGNYVAVAARLASVNGASQVGKVYVFHREENGFQLVQTLIPDPATTSTLFGESLAFDETGTVLLVGAARAEVGNQTDVGEVYLFTREGTVFAEQQRLRATDLQANGLYGISLSLSADGNSLAVGEAGANGNTGRVHFYTRDQGTYRPRQVIQANDSVSGDLFGTLALSGDGQTLIVSASGGDSPSLTDTGKAYLFTRSGNTFIQQQVLTVPDASASTRFGDGTIGISDDGTTFAIAARTPQKVYVYSRTGNSANSPQIITVPVSGDARIGIFPTMTGDGSSLFIGQPGANVDDLTRAGRILRFGRVNGSFVQQETIQASEPTAEATFGGAPVITPDGKTLVAGALTATVNGQASAGQAFVLERGTSTATVTLKRVEGQIGFQAASVGQQLVIATGTPDGSAMRYSFNTDGSSTSVGEKFQPFAGFTGVIQGTAGDVDGDGKADFIYATGRGNSLLRVISGTTNKDLVPAFATYEASFTGGVFVTALDIDNDGKVEIAVSPDVGGGGRVQIFSFVNGSLVQRDNFFGIEDPSFRGGARISLGDIDGDGVADLIVGAGFGGGPRIAIFKGTALLKGATTVEKLIPDFFAFPGNDAVTLRNGVFVSSGDLNGDGFADLVFGGGPGGGPRVFALSGKSVLADVSSAQSASLANFFVAGDSASRGGVRVAVKDVDNDLKLDLVVGSGEGQPSGIRTYLGSNLDVGNDEPEVSTMIDPFGGTVAAGVFVG